nr:hypothetical protein [Tanacetum cinerariifolium]
MNSDDTWEPRKDVTKNTSNSDSVKGRKGSTSKKVSCSKSTKTQHFKDLMFFDDSSSDDQGNVFRGKPGRTSVYSKGNKHPVSKKGSCLRKGSCSKGVVRGKPVESDVDNVEVIILKSDYDSPHSMTSDDTWEPGKDVTKNTSNSDSVKGRTGATSKKVSCYKSTKTKPFKDLKFFDDSSSDDQGSCSKGVVRGKRVESDVDSVEVIILESYYDSHHNMNSDDTLEPGKDVTKNTSNFVSVRGRKGLPSKKVSCSKSTKTIPFKDLKFFDGSSSDDEGNVFKGKPERTSVYSKGNKHSVSKKGHVQKVLLETTSIEELYLGACIVKNLATNYAKGFWYKNGNQHVAASQKGTSKGKRKMV